MDSYNFMTFSIDEKIHCIQHYEQSLIFLATSTQILLYNISNDLTICQCEHQTNQSFTKEKSNTQKQLQTQKATKQKSSLQFSPIEIHYFAQNVQKNYGQTQYKTLGYLLVHYKLEGLSTFKVQQQIQKQPVLLTHQVPSNQIRISFMQFFPIHFGAAFLKLSFIKQIYEQVNTNTNTLIQHTQQLIGSSINQETFESCIESVSKWIDFQLQNCLKEIQFFVFENDNQLFQIKRLLFREGNIQVKEKYQIDGENLKLSSSTVTEMKYFQFRYQSLMQKSQKFLILAMEGGNVCLYSLPPAKLNSPNSQYYLEPYRIIDIKNTLEFKPQSEDLDYSVISVQLLHQGLALLFVRNCGILLLDLRSFKVLSQLSLSTSNNKKYFFSDTRMIASLHSSISCNQKTQNNNKESHQALESSSTHPAKSSKVKTTLIASNKNTLKKLLIEIHINKYSLKSNLSNTQLFNVQSTVNPKIMSIITQQLNTPLIEGFLVVKKSQKQSLNHLNQTKSINLSQIEEIQVFGHFQHGKLFYFTP